jgi:hypothetical protein
MNGSDLKDIVLGGAAAGVGGAMSYGISKNMDASENVANLVGNASALGMILAQSADSENTNTPSPNLQNASNLNAHPAAVGNVNLPMQQEKPKSLPLIPRNNVSEMAHQGLLSTPLGMSKGR